jgi:hypothetical protein
LDTSWENSIDFHLDLVILEEKWFSLDETMEKIAHSCPYPKYKTQLQNVQIHILKNVYFHFIFWRWPVQHSQSNDLVIYEKTTVSSSTAGHENDGNTRRNVTSFLFASRQKRRQITEESFVSQSLMSELQALIAFACYNSPYIL